MEIPWDVVYNTVSVLIHIIVYVERIVEPYQCGAIESWVPCKAMKLTLTTL